jgi:hypothetical protein
MCKIFQNETYVDIAHHRTRDFRRYISTSQFCVRKLEQNEYLSEHVKQGSVYFYWDVSHPNYLSSYVKKTTRRAILDFRVRTSRWVRRMFLSILTETHIMTRVSSSILDMHTQLPSFSTQGAHTIFQNNTNNP